MIRFPFYSAWLVAALVMAGPASAQPSRSVGSASDDVPADVAARARNVAEASPRLREALAGRRTVFVGVDLIRRKGEGERELPPLYRVRHYRYADDTAVTTLIDLDSGRVADQMEARNAPVPLAQSELDEARAMALADRTVAAAVAPFRERLVIEPLVVRTSDPEDSWFGRRVVRLLFRIGPDYLSSPIVYVDLSRRQVIVERGHGPRPGDVQ